MSDATLLTGPATPLHKVAHRTIKDEVVERFATLIASGVLDVGDVLPGERELAHSMGVSRDSVRGALLVLATRGILSIVQGARTTVISTDLGPLGLSALTHGPVADYALDEVHQARLMVEGRLAPLAAARIEAQTLSTLRALIAAQEAACDDPLRFLISDRAFHTAVYQSCGNALFADLAATLYSYQLDHRRRAVAKPGAIAQSIADHHVILAALEAGDGAALVAALGIHEQRIYDSSRALRDQAAQKAQA